MHPVLAALRLRPPGTRIALLIEGGGTRGAVSGGMTLALDEALSPGLYEALLAARTKSHPLATDVATGRAVDLHPDIVDVASLRLALRATSMLPLLAGPPGHPRRPQAARCGAHCSDPDPCRPHRGATHVLVLRSRRAGKMTASPQGASARPTSRLLARIDPGWRGPSMRGRRPNSRTRRCLQSAPFG